MAAAAYLNQAREPVTFTASTSVFIQPSPLRSALGEPVILGDPNRTARNEATLLLSRDVATVVARDIGYTGDPRDLLGSVSATPVADADFLQIAATAGSGAQAALLANAFAQAYVRERSTNANDAVREAIAALQENLSEIPDILPNRAQRRSLTSRIERLQLILALPTTTARQFEVAEPPAQADGTPASRFAIFGFAVGFVLGLGAAYALEALGRRIKWSGDVEALYDQPLLAQLPHARNTERPGFSASADLVEGVRTLRTNLQLKGLNGSGAPVRTILVTSAVAGEGKSTVVRHLALAYREAGTRVVVVDADLRHSGLTRTVGLEGRPGLVQVIAGQNTLDDALVDVAVGGLGDTPGAADDGSQTSVPDEKGDPFARFFGEDGPKRLLPRSEGISVLAAGSGASDPAAALGSVKGLLEDLRGRFDVVVIDSAPLLPVSDALPLLRVVDGVLIATRLGVTTRNAAQELTRTLRRIATCETLGVVANDVRISEGLPTYGYEKTSDRRPRRLRLR